MESQISLAAVYTKVVELLEYMYIYMGLFEEYSLSQCARMAMRKCNLIDTQYNLGKVLYFFNIEQGIIRNV